jgi:hypothetical protein
VRGLPTKNLIITWNVYGPEGLGSPASGDCLAGPIQGAFGELVVREAVGRYVRCRFSQHRDTRRSRCWSLARVEGYQVLGLRQ